MKTVKQFLMMTFISLLLISCGQKPEKAIDFGSFQSGVYKNDYFNLEVAIPEAWNVLDDASRIELMKKSGRIVAGDNDNLNAVIEASDLQNMNLLTASKHPMGSPVPFNPSFVIVAEKVNHLPGIARGSDYHFHTKKLMESGAIKVSYPKEIYAQKIGEYTFDVMEMQIDMGSIKIMQKQYAAIIHDYALLFGITYSNAEELESLNQIVGAIALKP